MTVTISVLYCSQSVSSLFLALPTLLELLLAPLLLQRPAEGRAARAAAASVLGALQPQLLLADLHLPRHRRAPLLPRAVPLAADAVRRRRRLLHPERNKKKEFLCEYVNVRLKKQHLNFLNLLVLQQVTFRACR